MRTTPWTGEQQAAIRELETDNRIQNRRPCGCFDVVIDRDDAGVTQSATTVLCDTCREGLAKWRPEVFGQLKVN